MNRIAPASLLRSPDALTPADVSDIIHSWTVFRIMPDPTPALRAFMATVPPADIERWALDIADIIAEDA